MTDEQLHDFVPGLVQWEGAVAHMYRDVAGFPTVAIGSLIHDSEHACTFPFVTQGRPSSHAEIIADFHRVMALAKGMPAKSYRAPNEPRVELTADGIRDVTVSRLKHEFMPAIVRMFPDFEEFPRPAQEATLDWVWNCGPAAMQATVHLRPAIAKQNWPAAAAACHRKTSRDERNRWCESMFLLAATG